MTGSPSGEVRGAPSRPSSLPLSNELTGSTTGVCSSLSATSRPPRQKPPTTPQLEVMPITA